MISGDIKTDVEQEIKELVAVSYITEVLSQNLKYNVKQDCFSSSLILSVENRESEGVFYLTAKIC